MSKMMLLTAPLAMALVSLPLAARADTFKLYAPPGDETVVSTTNGPAFQVTSTSPDGYGGMELQVTSALTPSSLTTLSAMYEMTVGTFGGGAPRFTLFDSSFGSAYVYWGTPTGGGAFSDPNAGTWASTGNLASLASPDVRVYVNGFDNINQPNTGVTWQQFVNEAGATQISYVTLDLDGGWSEPPNGQQMDVNAFAVNSEVFDAPALPEPASIAVLGSAVALMAGVGRRRRKAA